MDDVIYREAIKHAEGLVKKYWGKETAHDVVHDLIADGVELTKENFKRLIGNKVRKDNAGAGEPIKSNGKSLTVYFTCNKCHDQFPDSERASYERTKDGKKVYKNTCKKCLSEQGSKHHEKNKEERNRRKREQYQANKSAINEKRRIAYAKNKNKVRTKKKAYYHHKKQSHVSTNVS